MKNISASIHQKLLNYSRENKLDFNLLLLRYANERFLYRLGVSEYKDQFLLKGATLFTIWFDAPLRPTRDIDLLGFGSNSIAVIKEIFIKICEIENADVIQFVPESVRGIEIKEGEEYQG